MTEKPAREYELARLILRLSNQIVQNRDRHVRALGLTTAQADSLQFFLAHPDAAILDLKHHLGVTHQTARGIVQRMEEKGLLQARRSQEDGRYQCIRATEKGEALGRQMIRNGTRTGSRLLHNMNQEQQDTFYALLQAALNNVEQT